MIQIKCNNCGGFIYELGEFRDDNECTCSIYNEESHLKNEIKRLKAKLKHVESHRDAHFKMSRHWYKQLRHTIDIIEKLTSGSNNFIDNICDLVDAAIFTGDALECKENRKEFKRLLERWSRRVDEWTESPEQEEINE